MKYKLTLLYIFSTKCNQSRVWGRGDNLNRVAQLIYALSFTQHLHWADVKDLEENIAGDLLLNPRAILIVRPIVEALHLDLSFDSKLATDKKIDVRLSLLFSDKTLIIIKNSLLSID